MTQVTFTSGENAVSASKMNQAVQGYRFLRRTTFTALPEAVFHRAHGRAAAIFIMGIGPGGGGAGAGGGAGTIAVGGGGGAGGYCWTYSTLQSVVRSPLKISAPAGAAGGAAGLPGAASTLWATVSYVNPGGVESFILVAGAGGGGQPSNLGTDVAFALGGTEGASQNGLVNMSGEAGGVGIRFGLFALSGRGGASRFRGTQIPTGLGVGMPAMSYGSGGSGAVASTTGFSGGNGGDSIVILDEYY